MERALTLRRGQRASVGLVVGVVALLAGEWILFTAGVNAHEMLVGGLAVVLSFVFLLVVYRSETQRVRVRLRDVLEAWRMPWYLLSDAWVITRVLVLDLLGKRAGSFYRVSGFRTAREQPEMVGRRVLATVYTSMSPNSIILGIDWKQSRMLMHQVARSPVSKMTRRLGGQP